MLPTEHSRGVSQFSVNSQHKRGKFMHNRPGFNFISKQLFGDLQLKRHLDQCFSQTFFKQQHPFIVFFTVWFSWIPL